MTHANTITKAPRACDSEGLHTDTNSTDFRSRGVVNQAHDGKAIATLDDLTLTTTPTEARVDSRLLAQGFGNKHKAATAALPQQALLIVGQLVAVNQAQGATDHHDAYPRIKNSLRALQGVLALEVKQHG